MKLLVRICVVAVCVVGIAGCDNIALEGKGEIDDSTELNAGGDEASAIVEEGLSPIAEGADGSRALKPLEPGEYWGAYEAFYRGQKRITITTVTAKEKNAGSDKADNVSIKLYWRKSDNRTFSEVFILSTPDRDDLEEGKKDEFFYKMEMQKYGFTGANGLGDKLIAMEIRNSSTDSWVPTSITIEEENWDQSAKRWTAFDLYENIDSPGNPVSKKYMVDGDSVTTQKGFIKYF